MSSQEFDLERRRELQSAIANLTAALWRLDPPAADNADNAAGDEAGEPGEPAPDGPIDLEKPLRLVFRAAGYEPEVVRRVVAALAPLEPEPEVEPQDVVKRAVRAAGYEPEVVRRVVAALAPQEPEPEVEPQDVVKRAVRAAGYEPEVVRRVMAALAPQEPEPEVEPQDVVKRAVRAAGYEPEVVRRVVAALAPPEPEPDLEPQDVVKRAVRAAGYEPEVVRRVVAALAPPEPEPDLEPQDVVKRAVRAAGYEPEVVRRVVAALAPQEPEPELEPQDVVKRALRTAGYRPDLSRLVLSVLDRYDDADADADGRDSGSVAEPVRQLLRVAGYRTDLINLVLALLGRYGDPEQAESGLRVGDLLPLVEQTEDGLDVREPVRRILRVAGHRTDLVNLIGALLDRFGDAETPTGGPRIRDLAELLEDPDEDLLALMRHWRSPEAGARHLGHELVVLLGHAGVDEDAARDLAAAITQDPQGERLKEIARVSRFALTAEDACISMAEPAWLEDPTFAAAYAEAKKISAWGRDIRWRVQTLVKLAAVARHLEGDFVECGVDTGGTARAVMAYLGDGAFEGRTFYLFDTFRGIVPEQLLSDEPAPVEDRFPEVAAVARANFADKPYARIVEGVVPQTLSEYTGSQVAFLHIDMNAAYPEVEALRYFWDRLTPGAPVVFDDYGFPRHRAQRRALDEAAAALDVEIMMLPTCQGIVFKPAKGV
ncbi:class I SAM-dependent methyltransferase [Nocardioides antri]|uniref:Class I SAM-dependent methyltransferase n=1 Tax=Nocardioides antri TaxID=2607659 RepID=A0A5B1M8V8_9ACTN|nr:class I SAM-dependent methyltransferase [Nocardioides antri]KAA1428419.1 class I SAM-dependent methyltransferase [Nocardioides antri]